VEDVSLCIQRLVMTAPKNAVWMGISGCEEISYPSIILPQSIAIIIPMGRHRMRIPDEGSQQHGSEALTSFAV
jgi:hypothetical protein